MSQLINDLRKWPGDCGLRDPLSASELADLMGEAADQIEQLMLALTPFAAAQQLVATSTPDDHVLRFGFEAHRFRRARAAFELARLARKRETT